MNGYLKDETEELGPSPYTRAYPATYPAPAPPPTGTPRRSRTAGSTRRGVKLQRYHFLARTEPAVARRVQLQSLAEVTMKFVGPSLVLTNSMFPEDRLSEVMVLQQHCGGSTLCVFRELLPPNTIFTFISRRHRGSPFGLTFYIDGMQDIRLSCCCEYKHKPGHVLGGRNGHFQFVVVEGAAPCYRCQVASAHRYSKKHKSIDEADRSKTFMTETANDQEEEEQGETFDVIITKLKPESDGDQVDGDEEKDEGEMVDSSTQTPRDENNAKDKEELTVEDEENTKENNPDEGGDEGEESGADKYENDEFEESPDKEENNKEESDAKQDTDKEDDKDDKNGKDDEEYNEDFESDGEKEKSKSESEGEEDEDSEKEDDEPEDDIPDETEEKQASDTGKQEDDAEEIEDETDRENKHDAERPASPTDSEGRHSKNVSFDEDVTVIEGDQDGERGEEGEETPDEVPDDEETPAWECTTRKFKTAASQHRRN